MKYRLIILLLALICVRCSNNTFEHIDVERGDETSMVRFNLHSADNISVETKGYDATLSDSEESAIDNYNIFCFNLQNGEEIHQYVTSGKAVDLLLEKGTWEIYVVANTNSDLGTKTIESLKTYSVNYITAGNLLNDSRLHMSYYDTIEVTKDATIDLKLERAYAKVNIDITLSGAATDYTIISREVKRAPMLGYLFKDNISTFTGIHFSPDENFSFYMFENLQGINTDITSAKNKIAANAPTYATYIEVVAQSSTQEITYTYYLGENTINDFNIRRNHTYNINMNISGNSSSDLRVETSTLPTVDPEPTYTITGDTSRNISVDGSWFSIFDDDFTYTLEFESGDSSSIDIELNADIYGVNNDDQIEYFAMLFTESIYDKFVAGVYGDNDIWTSSLNLLRDSSGSVAAASCYTSSWMMNFQRTTYATVTPNTTYKLVLQRYNQPYGEPATSHNIRLYMNKGTTNQKYVDLLFSTIFEEN